MPPAPTPSPPPPGRRSGGPGKPGGKPGEGAPRRPSLLTLVLIAWAVFFVASWLTGEQVPAIPYSEFRELLAEGQVADLEVSETEIRGRRLDTESGEPQPFRTVRVDDELADELAERDLEFTGFVEQTFFSDLLIALLPLLLIVGLWIFLLRRAVGRGGPGGGLMGVGKSKARVYVEEQVGVTFNDVAGVDEAKQELTEIIGFLEDPSDYSRLGARLPKGILLVGPPGTGKTLMARAVAGEAGVPFFSISGSEFVELFVGVGAARVRDLFEQARQRAPCIIFIDELDALGRARGAAGSTSGGNDEKEQTLNQLLVELDGFDPSQGVVLLAATNRPEILDPALLRAGRFDRQVLLDKPDKRAREAILVVHLARVELDDTVSPEQIAALTPGFTGADLATLVNEAAIQATRRGADAVSMDDVTSAIERIVAGLEKRNRLLNPHERRVTAYHEMGHALVSKALSTVEQVHKVSIIPRGIGSLGYTIQRPTEDRFLMTERELLDKMTVLLAGRAAEHVVFDTTSTGAADDLVKATDIARAMVTRFGMHAGLGQVALESERTSLLNAPTEPLVGARRYSEETAREIDCAVRELVERAYGHARGLLERHRAALEDGATRLLEKETLTADELPALGGHAPAVDDDTAGGDDAVPPDGDAPPRGGEGR